MDPGIFDKVIDAIKTIGVPAAIAFFILWRTDRKLDRLIVLLEKMNGMRGEK